MRTRVLDPLEMKSSTYEQPLPAKLRERAATGYRGNGSAVAGKHHTYPEMAAAGLWTTPSDYARYVIGVQRALRGDGKTVISKTMAERMLTSGMGNYGLGPGVAGEGEALRFAHGGANEGFRSYFVAYANTGEGVVVMTNSDTGSPLAQEIVTSVARVYGWPGLEIETLEPVVMESAALDAYIGEYRDGNNEANRVAITRRGDALFIGQGGNDPLELIAVGRDRFFQPERLWRVTFERDASGDIVALSPGGQVRAVKVR
jgi:CubicO group peptidase (beta-lactamase class C family)